MTLSSLLYTCKGQGDRIQYLQEMFKLIYVLYKVQFLQECLNPWWYTNAVPMFLLSQPFRVLVYEKVLQASL